MVNSGLRDWLYQRVSAIFMAVYSLGLVVYVLAHPDLAYYEWHHLFTYMSMKVVTLLFVFLLLIHAWVGMWTVITDYIKPFVLRLMINIVILLALVGFFFQTILILWGI